MPKNKFIVRDTAKKIGRNIMMTPKNTPLKALSCGRIILNQKHNRAAASSKGREGSGFPRKRYLVADRVAVLPRDADEAPIEAPRLARAPLQFHRLTDCDRRSLRRSRLDD